MVNVTPNFIGDGLPLETGTAGLPADWASVARVPPTASMPNSASENAPITAARGCSAGNPTRDEGSLPWQC